MIITLRPLWKSLGSQHKQGPALRDSGNLIWGLEETGLGKKNPGGCTCVCVCVFRRSGIQWITVFEYKPYASLFRWEGNKYVRLGRFLSAKNSTTINKLICNMIHFCQLQHKTLTHRYIIEPQVLLCCHLAKSLSSADPSNRIGCFSFLLGQIDMNVFCNYPPLPELLLFFVELFVTVCSIAPSGYGWYCTHQLWEDVRKRTKWISLEATVHPHMDF